MRILRFLKLSKGDAAPTVDTGFDFRDELASMRGAWPPLMKQRR